MYRAKRAPDLIPGPLDPLVLWCPAYGVLCLEFGFQHLYMTVPLLYANGVKYHSPGQSDRESSSGHAALGYQQNNPAVERMMWIAHSLVPRPQWYSVCYCILPGFGW